MAYDFHYTPTGTGVISGKEVLEQTEDAINDLGNTAISGVQEALDKAEQALTNSENAVDDAQTALNTANNAEGVAIQAQTDVGNLSGTVTNIGNRVTTAEGNITNLQGRMTTAEGNITNLQGRMTTAETNIGNLQTAVSTAQATANSAQQTATTARQQSYVLRYSSASVTDNSTIAYSTLDNTDNIKSGDKVIDVNGKIFTIVSVDTANQTVTVGSALIDLALDGNVVHTSGNENVGGIKNFTDDTYIKSLNFTNEVPSPSSSFSSIMPIIATITYGDSSPSVQARLNLRITADGTKSLYPHENNQYSFGLTSRRWTTLYGYLANLGGTYIGNESSDNERTNLYLLANRDTDGQSGAYIGRFRQNRAQGAMSDGDVSYVSLDFLENSTRYTRCFTMGLTDWDSNGVPQTYYLTSPSSKGSLGTSSQKWATINGLEPSALGMPDLNNGLDISGYITVNGGNKESLYTPPVNGWISVALTRTGGVNMAVMLKQGNFASSGHNIAQENGTTTCNAMLPVIGGVQVSINSALADGIAFAYFYPCQGNI